MKNKFSIPFEVDKNGKFLISKDDREALNSFNSAHPGQQGQMTLEAFSGDRARRHWQHRKYRAEILPAIFEICGGLGVDHFHEWQLKPMFKTIIVRSQEEIPWNYTKGRKPGRFKEVQKVENGKMTDIWIEYVPSTSSFSIEEFDEYIFNCKQLLEGLQSAGSLKEVEQMMMR